MNADDVIKKFYVELITSLPMKNALFRASLTANDLLPGDLKSVILSKSTKEEMVEYFLDNGINNDIESFYRLLTVMKLSKHNQLKVLATKMQSCVETGQ